MAGNIAKRSNGMWRARFRDEGGHERARHFARKVDAQRWLDETATTVARGTYVDPAAGRMTFQQFYREWSVRQVWVSGTFLAMDLAVSTTTFSQIPLRAIRRSHVETWVKRMVDAELAPGTIKTRFNNVRAVFRAATRDHLIGSDPSDQVALPRLRRADRSMRIPTTKEVGTLVASADESFRAFVALCAFAGLRLGEAAALKVDDIDFDAGEITVARQIQRAGNASVEIRAPKYGSERMVAMAPGLSVLVAAHLDAHPVGEEGWLFTAPSGDPPHQNTVGYWWRKTLRDASLSGIKLHDLRHFFASGLIAAGCDVVTVQRALGHSKPTTTLNTYAHLWPTAADRTRKAAQGLIRTSGVQKVADSLRTGDT